MPHTLLKRQTIGRLKSRPLCAGPDKVAEMAKRVGIEGYRGLVNGYYAAAGDFVRFPHRHIGVCIGLARKITRPHRLAQEGKDNAALPAEKAGHKQEQCGNIIICFAGFYNPFR